jgi:mono/diheme cytochrome c family protein
VAEAGPSGPGQIEDRGSRIEDRGSKIEAGAGSESGVRSGAGASQEFAAGKRVFGQHCTKCHAIGGSGGPSGGFGPGKSRGPDLGTVGTKRSQDWLMEHVRNPKAHNPQSRMPGFEGKIDQADLRALGEYLASLK